MIVVKKNVVCFFEFIVIRKIDIIKILGNRCIFSVKFECGGLYGVLFYVSYLFDEWYCDFNDVCLMV